jgi:hypothetical protein
LLQGDQGYRMLRSRRVRRDICRLRSASVAQLLRCFALLGMTVQRGHQGLSELVSF